MIPTKGAIIPAADETPAAYKWIDVVMAAQADLVEIVHTLRQVVCVKGCRRRPGAHPPKTLH